MGIWGRSRLAGNAAADDGAGRSHWEDMPYAPLYDEDGPGDPEFGAWLDQKLGLKPEAEPDAEPGKRTRWWWIKRGLLAALRSEERRVGKGWREGRSAAEKTERDAD